MRCGKRRNGSKCMKSLMGDMKLPLFMIHSPFLGTQASRPASTPEACVPSAPARAPSVDVLPKGLGPLGFELIDLPFQPSLNDALCLNFVAVHLELFNRVASFIQGDEMTRNRLRAVVLADEIKQMTFRARVGAVGISVVQTTQRILEDGLW